MWPNVVGKWMSGALTPTASGPRASCRVRRVPLTFGADDPEWVIGGRAVARRAAELAHVVNREHRRRRVSGYM